jgi:hypothetical protein
MNLRRACLGSALLTFASILTTPRSAHADATARVHVASKIPVQLERHVVERQEWELVCVAPCDQDVSLADEYRIVDAKQPGVGEPLRLRAEPGGAVTLTYAPASVPAKVAGGVLVTAGGVLAAFGTAGLIGGVTLASSGGGCGPQSGDWCGLGQAIGTLIAIVGGVGMLAGGGMVLGGVALLGDSGASTKQRRTPDAAFVREPAWLGPRLASPAAAAATPRSTMLVPLTFSF